MTQKFEDLLANVIGPDGRIKADTGFVQVGLEDYGLSESRDTISGFGYYTTSWDGPFLTVKRPHGVLGWIRGNLIIYMVPLDVRCQDGVFDILVGPIPNRRIHPFPPAISYAGRYSIGAAWKYRSQTLRTYLTKDFSREEQIMLEAMIGKK